MFHIYRSRSGTCKIRFVDFLPIIALLGISGASLFIETKPPPTSPTARTPVPSATPLPGNYALQLEPVYSSTSTQTPSTGQPTSLPTKAPDTLPSSTSPSGQAMPIGDIAGWHQVFADDFTGTTLNTSNWGAYSGQPGGDPAGWWDPSHVVVKGGLLTLEGYKDPAVKADVYVTGGIGMNGSYAQTYGKYLVRMRVDKGDGLSAIALLWPQANAWPPEVDFFEDGGGDRTSMLATLHCGSNGEDNCQVMKGLSGYDFSQWHTIGVVWTPGKLVYTIDDTIWATVTDSGVPSIPMVLDLQSQSLACSQYNTCLDSSTPTEVDMQVDWVVTYTPAQ
jgi:beta-glucanase (GH16 family)